MQKEQLSALMDGELIDNELIDKLMNDTALQKQWFRYHLIRDALRNDAMSSAYIDVTHQVAQVISDDNSYSIEEDQPLPEHCPTPSFWHKVKPWLSAVGQAGLAASIAVAVIIGVQQYNNTPDGSQIFQPTPAFGSFTLGNMTKPVSYDVGTNNANKLDHRRQFALLQTYELQRRLYAFPIHEMIKPTTETASSTNSTNE